MFLAEYKLLKMLESGLFMLFIIKLMEESLVDTIELVFENDFIIFKMIEHLA